MKKRRSLLLIIFVALFALVAASCGNDDDGGSSETTAVPVETTAAPTETTAAPTETTAAPTETTAAPTETTAAPTETTAAAAGGTPGEKRAALVYDIGGRGDKSFNDAAAAGLDKAKAELGFETKELEPSQGGENRQELLKLAAEEGFPLVFAIGFAFADAVKAEAATHADTKFAIVDSVVDAPNVTSLVFAEHEGSYLVGVAAALKSKSGHVGFIGGVEIDLIKKFQAGFEAGAKSVKADITIDVKYISQPPDFSGFGDPAKGKEAAKGMYDAGADVIFHAAGGTGGGVFDAAVEGGDGKWAIGVDSDQWQSASPEQQKHILTSMLKRVDVAVFETAKAHAETGLTGGVQVFNLKRDGVGYSTSGGYVDDIKDQLEAAKAKIVSGEITVPDKLG